MNFLLVSFIIGGSTVLSLAQGEVITGGWKQNFNVISSCLCFEIPGKFPIDPPNFVALKLNEFQIHLNTLFITKRTIYIQSLDMAMDPPNLEAKWRRIQ